MIGKKVKVIIDRPLGSIHPEYNDIYYSVNYGYIEGHNAPDGEEQDAYLLNIFEPLKEYNGIVTAIIIRKNDIEDKWVVIPEGTSITTADILLLTHFQEKFFEIEIKR